jgi:hypothetical protein
LFRDFLGCYLVWQALTFLWSFRGLLMCRYSTGWAGLMSRKRKQELQCANLVRLEQFSPAQPSALIFLLIVSSAERYHTNAVNL